MYFVVTTGNGLTRRLVEGKSFAEVKKKYIESVAPISGFGPKMNRTITAGDDEIQIRIATAADMEEFGRKKRRSKKPGDEQASWDLPGTQPDRRKTNPREKGV